MAELNSNAGENKCRSNARFAPMAEAVVDTKAALQQGSHFDSSSIRRQTFRGQEANFHEG